MRRPARRESARDFGSGVRDRHDWGARSTGRGQTTTLEYTLTLGVAALVVTGLFAAAGDFVSSQRENVIRTELGVVGQQLASELVAADRLVHAGTETQALSVRATLPRRVAGAPYTVTITDDGSAYWLNLTTTNPTVSVSVRVEITTDLATGSVNGGNLDVVYDPTGPRLEVRG